MKRAPVVDIGECVDCECCLELCPEVFRKNEMGYIEVISIPECPETTIREAMNMCPTDCITWEERGG